VAKSGKPFLSILLFNAHTRISFLKSRSTLRNPFASSIQKDIPSSTLNWAFYLHTIYIPTSIPKAITQSELSSTHTHTIKLFGKAKVYLLNLPLQQQPHTKWIGLAANAAETAIALHATAAIASAWAAYILADQSPKHLGPAAHDGPQSSGGEAKAIIAPWWQPVFGLLETIKERVGLLYVHKGPKGRTTRSLPLGLRFLCILELIWRSFLCIYRFSSQLIIELSIPALYL